MATFTALNSMENKYLYICAISVSLVVLGCKEEAKQLSAEEVPVEQTVLSPLIKYTVLAEDTSFNYMMKKDTAFINIYRNKDSAKFKGLVTNINYIPAVEFENYKLGLLKFFKNEQYIVCDKELSILKDEKSRKSIYVMCDSIQFTDEPNTPKVWMCDSTSTLTYLQGFDFYEKWSLDNKSGNIIKEVLAYSPVKYNEKKKQFVPLFYVFKNKETYEQVKTKIQNK